MKQEDIKSGDKLFYIPSDSTIIEVIVSETWDFNSAYVDFNNQQDCVSCDNLYRTKIDYYNSRIEQLDISINYGDNFVSKWEDKRNNLIEKKNDLLKLIKANK